LDRCTRGGATNDYVYDMLLVADTFHDFGTADITVPMLPHGIIIDDLRKEKVFIYKIAALKNLQFDKKKVENPLYGANILKRFDIENFENFDKCFAKQQSQINGILGNKRPRLLPLDIWTEVDPGTEGTIRRRTQVIKLHQIAQLIGTTRAFFGDTLDLVIDASGNQLTMIVVSIKYITKSLFKRFTTDPLSTNLQEITQSLKDFMHSQENVAEWNPSVVDANIFDPADNTIALPVDHRPTGDIYKLGLPYQVRLNGITTTGGRRVHVVINEGDREHTHGDFFL